MNLLEECIDALLNSKSKMEALYGQTQEKILETFFNAFPYDYGRIVWKKIDQKFNIQDISQITTILQKRGKKIHIPIYVIWDMTKLPIIKCDLMDAIENIDDITAVSFDTWLYSPENRWVLEFYHEGDITLGFEN